MSRRHVTRLCLAWFAASAALLVSPLYDVLGNHVEPRVLGHPWSLVYVLLIVAINVVVLVGLYLAGTVDAGDGPS